MDESTHYPREHGLGAENRLRRGLALLAIVVAASLSGHLLVDDAAYGLYALLPTLVVIGMALITRRTLEALLAGCLSGFLILSPTTAVQDMAVSGLEVMQNPTMGWIILVCGLLGSLIGLLQFARGTEAFSLSAGRYLKNRRTAMLGATGLGALIFIDDYLNAMTVSAAMKRLFDRLRISRSMLAYIVDSTAAPICLLIPFSTWAIYLAGLLESHQLAEAGKGFSYYLGLVPYLIYPWVALMLVLLVASGIVPALGRMKAAERGEEARDDELASDDTERQTHRPPRLVNFVLPVVTLLLATWWFDIDALIGVGFALLVTLGLYIAQDIAPLNRLFDELLAGFQQMLLPLGIVFAAFILQSVNESLGLTETLIAWVEPVMRGSWLPGVTFLLLAALAFATGSFWGVYAIAFPIVIPIAQATDASLPLTLGAMISAGAFGSHACFFGDATVLSARGCGISPIQHALTQLPYVLLAALISAVAFFLLA
ncbi:Na+/H+ antiporter NhaC family protein [Halomonas elongata]|uniref:Na+/H+ antiporter NhaC family protein n=1 Tax=Halomonas elongata TaxID=2746 RepID=UPI00255B2E8E|nr:Na+/H+ antiporter NhaC family protein [Halomonas elongata]MDL4862388.1 Na+/H+ antiporter NhaC family protein [Halomonas elongata]